MDHGEGEWRAPGRDACRLFAPEIPAAIEHALAYCERATEPVIYRCLAGLALVCQPTNGDTETMWQTRASEYARILGHYPSDIWQDACDEWATTPDRGRWYPTVAELAERMEPRLRKRHNVIARLRKMLDIARAEQEMRAEPTDEEKARVTQIVADYRARMAREDALR